ncbi:hemerythrin domain-containing protein [Rugosimonospora africana]|uniref:Hemerythrin n=1 Tax=Rugosimonospora africana TaxID=556532 RepID=A0A8J3VND6_9ACTN|nr:hemerythrin domain-containing protein [Rugosimonospora africana]GIH12850.1 hemerythrin [Rugosimonospora africana]
MTQTAQRDVIDMLSQEHREIEELFVRLDELAATRDAPDSDGERAEARVIADQAITELTRHWVAEERHLYPAVRENVPDLEQVADRELAEHAKAERNMKALERLDPDDEEFWIRTEVLIGLVRAHIQVEEDQVFPGLRDAVPRELLVELGGKVERAQRAGPTHPHPAAPDRPPGNRLVDPATGLMDRIRDAVSSRGRAQ